MCRSDARDDEGHARIVKMLDELKIPAYDETSNSGIIKTIAIRESLATGELQVTLITNTAKLIHKGPLLAMIAEQLPEVKSVEQNVNPGDTPLVGVSKRFIWPVRNTLPNH